MTNSPTYEPTTQAPTLNPQDQQMINDANDILLMIGVGIIFMLVGFLMAIFFHRAWTVSKLNRLKRQMLLKQAEEAKTSNDDVKKQLLIDEFKKLQRESRGIMHGVGENFAGPLMDSLDADSANEFLFHSSVGRSLTISFKELNSQISWLLGWMLINLITGFLQSEVISKAANTAQVFGKSVGVVAAAWIVHRVFLVSTVAPIDKRLEENTVFYDQVAAFKKKNNL